MAAQEERDEGWRRRREPERSELRWQMAEQQELGAEVSARKPSPTRTNKTAALAVSALKSQVRRWGDGR